MKDFVNKVNIVGYVYDHNLEIRTVQKEDSPYFNTDFIFGTLDIVVDDEGLNVVSVRYNFEPVTFKSKKENSKYTALKKIMDEGKKWIDCGNEATKVSVNASVGLNDFQNKDGEMVSAKIIDGGFITFVPNIFGGADRNKFTLDFLITNVTRMDAIEERNLPAYCKVRGAAFNSFRKQILPMELQIRNEEGMNYFESLDASTTNPYFVNLWGTVNSVTTMVERKQETAFGEAVVTTYPRKEKSWLITGANPDPIDFGDPEILTMDDITKMAQEREVMLADVAKRAEERKAAAQAPQAIPGINPNFGF